MTDKEMGECEFSHNFIVRGPTLKLPFFLFFNFQFFNISLHIFYLQKAPNLHTTCSNRQVFASSFSGLQNKSSARTSTKMSNPKIRKYKQRESQRPPRELAVYDHHSDMKMYGPKKNLVYCFFFDAVDWIDTAGWTCPQCGWFHEYFESEGITKPVDADVKLYGVRDCPNMRCLSMLYYQREPTQKEMDKEVLGIIGYLKELLLKMPKKTAEPAQQQDTPQ